MAIISHLLAAGYGNTQFMLNYNDNNLIAQAFVLSADKDSPFSMRWWCILAGNYFSGIVRQGTMADQFPIASYGIKGEIRTYRGFQYIYWPFTEIGVTLAASMDKASS